MIIQDYGQNLKLVTKWIININLFLSTDSLEYPTEISFCSLSFVVCSFWYPFIDNVRSFVFCHTSPLLYLGNYPINDQDDLIHTLLHCTQTKCIRCLCLRDQHIPIFYKCWNHFLTVCLEQCMKQNAWRVLQKHFLFPLLSGRYQTYKSLPC